MAILDKFRLDGQVALVTGGGSGIGRAACLVLGEAGASVMVLDHNPAAAQETVEALVRIGAPAIAAVADITQEAEVAQACDTVAERFGRLDVLVASAGSAIRAAALELPLAAWDKVVAVNLTGTFLCARHAARQIQASSRGGRIVFVSSIMGLSGGGLYPNVSYQATKGAVVNMTRALAVEWAALGIRVNAVAPTWVRTPFIAPLLEQPALMREIERMTPLGRIAEPEEVAAAILYLAAPASAMVTGHVLAVDGGFLAQ
ncbi:MAG TPA: SDR family NAD(P)-dependent oxidoreductase [Rhizomicrobium sp.]